VRLGRAADHSPPSSTAVMEEYSYTSTHPLGHTGPVKGTLYLYRVYTEESITRLERRENEGLSYSKRKQTGVTRQCTSIYVFISLSFEKIQLSEAILWP